MSQSFLDRDPLMRLLLIGVVALVFTWYVAQLVLLSLIHRLPSPIPALIVLVTVALIPAAIFLLALVSPLRDKPVAGLIRRQRYVIAAAFVAAYVSQVAVVTVALENKLGSRLPSLGPEFDLLLVLSPDPKLPFFPRTKEGAKAIQETLEEERKKRDFDGRFELLEQTVSLMWVDAQGESRALAVQGAGFVAALVLVLGLGLARFLDYRWERESRTRSLIGKL